MIPLANTLTGRVLWYDRKEQRGIIVCEGLNEYYVDSSVLSGCLYLDAKDEVIFKSRMLGGTLCAYDVSLVPTPCEGKDGCGVEDCQTCCPHNEHDHFICLDCGYEGEPSDYYDEDYGKDR